MFCRMPVSCDYNQREKVFLLFEFIYVRKYLMASQDSQGSSFTEIILYVYDNKYSIHVVFQTEKLQTKRNNRKPILPDSDEYQLIIFIQIYIYKLTKKNQHAKQTTAIVIGFQKTILLTCRQQQQVNSIKTNQYLKFAKRHCQIIYQMDDIALAETSSKYEHLIHQDHAKTITQQTDIYEISGNSYTIIEHQKKMVDVKQYKILKINIMGSCVQSFNYGCFYFLITNIILFFFPIFLLWSDCCRRKLYNLFTIKQQVYEAMGQVIARVRPTECYIVIQDNYFNEAKCNALGRGLQRSPVSKFQMVNTSQGINTYGHNYSDFPIYCRHLKQVIPNTKCRWGDKSI